MSEDRITWTNEKRKLSELIPWPRNPRQIKSDQVKRLQDSLDQFGQVDTIAIGPGNEVYNGHQRLKSWAAEFGDVEVDVRVSSRPLTEKEREKLTVYLHKGAAGEWDFDVLANEFELGDLLDWGFQGWELGVAADAVDYEELWQGMPEFEQEDAESFDSIKVHFRNQQDREDFLEMLGEDRDRKKSIWYPKMDYLKQS